MRPSDRFWNLLIYCRCKDYLILNRASHYNDNDTFISILYIYIYIVYIYIFMYLYFIYICCIYIYIYICICNCFYKCSYGWSWRYCMGGLRMRSDRRNNDTSRVLFVPLLLKFCSFSLINWCSIYIGTVFILTSIN